MKSSKKIAQAGFTLIELIIVIVIISIMGAIALQKYGGLAADARLASMRAAKASLNSTAVMAHARYIANTSGAPLTSITVEGTVISFAASGTGYPIADLNLATAAGLTADGYTIYGPGHKADPYSLGTNADEIMIVPNSLAKSPAGVACYVKYKEAAAPGRAPIISTPAIDASDCE